MRWQVAEFTRLARRNGATIGAMGAREIYEITQHNPALFTDEEIALGTEFGNAISAELLPDDPPTPVDVAIAGNRKTPARYRRVTFRAWAPDGTLVGSVGTGFDPEHDDNPDVIGCRVNVHKDHRRKGIGTRLLAHMVAVAYAEGRTRMIGSTVAEMAAGPEFARAFGFESKTAMHVNHLPTAEVDRTLMEKWVAEGPTRAPDYELLVWEGRVPDEHLKPFIDLYLVMNDAPRDDLKVNDFTITEKEWREWDDQREAIGGELWTVVARRKSDGVFAGFHNINWAPHDPKVMWIDSTGVRPEHRGHALGKWLKATMTLKILDERPEVDDIRTGNADSNDPMLGINREMGYRPLFATETWEVGVESLAKSLEARGVAIPGIEPIRSKAEVQAGS